MNWFSKIQQKDLLKQARYYKTKGIKKYAEKSFDWKNQMEEIITFGDVQRYVMDAYSVKLFVSKTSDNITISLVTNHAYLGTVQYSVFWLYNLDEEAKAKKHFTKINSIIKEVTKDFIDNRKPTSLFTPTLREKVQLIQDANLVRTNIPTINYSYDIDYSGKWDKNIYGNRYPSYKEQSFSQHLNSSYYAKDNKVKGKFSM